MRSAFSARRIGSSAPALVVLLVAALLGQASNAGAEDRGQLTVVFDGGPVTQAYPPIPDPGAAGGAAPAPDSCRDSSSCDVIELRLEGGPWRAHAPVAPSHVSVRLSWDSADFAYSGYCALTVWADPEGSQQVGRAPCRSHTATVVFAATQGTYSVVVENAASLLLHRGYELTAQYLAGPVPVSLEAPSVEHARLPSFDGTILDGWIIRPAGSSAPLPTVLWSAPYFGQTYPAGNDPALWDNSSPAEAVPVNLLLSRGYAVAIFNVRGSGNSGGCLDVYGHDEQKDQAFLVDWLGGQAWSNGNVAMMGLSYHGTTPWEAAIERPKHLRTIVVAGMVSDTYLLSHSPQGATLTGLVGHRATSNSLVSFAPPAVNLDPAAYAPAASERICDDVIAASTEDPVGLLTDNRNEAFWDERRLIDRFPDVEIPVLITHGFQDSGHVLQESEAWGALTQAPKLELKGQWGHEFPNFNTRRGAEWVMHDWNQRLLAWLDHWLLGVGPTPTTGVIEYQDGSGLWRTSGSWPPAEARDEALYFSGSGLAAQPSAEPQRFLASPKTAFDYDVYRAICSEAGLPEDLRTGRIFETAPLTQNATLAGNPFVYLNITSDEPGGLVAVQLVDVAPDASCSPVPYNKGIQIRLGTREARPIAHGSADLRFHQGSFQGTDFPVGAPTPVRVDLTHLAEVIPAGHKLAVVVSRVDVMESQSQPFTPRIDIHPDSHLVAPLVDSSFGGGQPLTNYPPRPFLP